jgi:hypothetical protein
MLYKRISDKYMSYMTGDIRHKYRLYKVMVSGDAKTLIKASKHLPPLRKMLSKEYLDLVDRVREKMCREAYLTYALANKILHFQGVRTG